MAQEKGKVFAVVTGASSGIGRAFAELFAEDGINLVLAADNGKVMASVAAEIKKKYKVEVFVSAGDLTKPSVAKGLFDFVVKQKLAVEYLVNSAGVGIYGDFLKTDWAKEQTIINLNVASMTYLNKVFSQYMAQKGYGRIVNLASTGGFVELPHMAVYSASKAYVLSLSRSLSKELKGTGVHVTALAPTRTRTNFHRRANTPEKHWKNRRSLSPKYVAVSGYNAMLLGKSVVVPGVKGKLTVWFPRRLSTNMLRHSYGRRLKAKQS